MRIMTYSLTRGLRSASLPTCLLTLSLVGLLGCSGQGTTTTGANLTTPPTPVQSVSDEPPLPEYSQAELAALAQTDPVRENQFFFGRYTIVVLSLKDLPGLGPDMVYQAWLADEAEDSWTSLGRFRNTEDAGTHVRFFLARRQTVRDAEALYVSIEPKHDDAAEPAETVLLCGMLEGHINQLSTEPLTALGTMLTDASGRYLLRSITMNPIPFNHQGVWFAAVNGDDEYEATLTLPTLSAGWTYEAFLFKEEQYFSLGRFTSAEGPDSDGPGMYLGNAPEQQIPFPGSDFVDGPIEIVGGGMVLVSVEPEPDTNDDPFAIQLLNDIIESPTEPGPHDLINRAEETVPDGRVLLIGRL